MSKHPANGDRVIMTAKLIVEMLLEAGMPYDIISYLVAPWKLEPDQARIMFYERRLTILMDVNGGSYESRKMCSSAIKDFQNAYDKCSVFEREAIKKDLIAMGL